MRDAFPTIISAARRLARRCADERGASVTEYVAFAVGGFILASGVVAVVTLWSNGWLGKMLNGH